MRGIVPELAVKGDGGLSLHELSYRKFAGKHKQTQDGLSRFLLHDPTVEGRSPSNQVPSDHMIQQCHKSIEYLLLQFSMKTISQLVGTPCATPVKSRLLRSFYCYRGPWFLPHVCWVCECLCPWDLGGAFSVERCFFFPPFHSPIRDFIWTNICIFT